MWTVMGPGDGGEVGGVNISSNVYERTYHVAMGVWSESIVQSRLSRIYPALK